MVDLTVHDVLGREVAHPVHEHEAAGTYTVQWSPGPTTASGVYLARLQAGGRTAVVKMVLMK